MWLRHKHVFSNVRPIKFTSQIKYFEVPGISTWYEYHVKPMPCSYTVHTNAVTRILKACTVGASALLFVVCLTLLALHDS